MKNHLLLKIAKKTNFEQIIGENQFSKDKISLTINRNSIFEFNGLNYKFNENEGILTAVLGYFSNWEQIKEKSEFKTDVEFIENKYLSGKNDNLSNFTSNLDGIYLLIIYDLKQNKLLVFQSIFGYALPVYYASDNQFFNISTSLKTLLQHTNIDRQLDKEAASAFVGQQIIQNDRTLIKNVNKLVTHTYLEYDLQSNTISTHWSSNILPEIDETEAKKVLVPSIGNNVISIAKSLKTKIIHSTLTRGWDTNMILNHLNKSNPEKLVLYSIDGGNQYSEVEEVKQILRYYNSTELHVHEIESDTLNYLPEIVWRYEGFVFEMGIFLRYNLANKLLNGKTDHVFVGSGADPVLDSNMGPGGNNAFQHFGLSAFKSTMFTVKKKIKGSIIGDIIFKYLKKESKEDYMRRKLFNPNFKSRYNFEVEYNLKMHDLMFNSFGITGIYPFLNKKTVTAANALRPINHKKAFYKEQLKDLFGEDIAAIIKKTGKVLDTDRLYFEKRASFIKMLEKPFFDEFMPKNLIAKIRKEPDQHKSIIPHMAYVYVFNCIFTGKNFDKYANNETMEIKLDDLIE